MSTNSNPTSAPGGTPLNVRSLPGRAWLVRLGLILPLFLGSVAGRAADNNPAELMTYQGTLTDQNGVVLGLSAPVNYAAVFRIYDHSSAGVLLWAESQVITVDKGLFSVQLGQGSAHGSEPRPPLSTVLSPNGVSALASDRFIALNVTLGGVATDILPRLRLVPSAFAFLARNANNILDSSGAAVVTTAPGMVGINKTPTSALDVNGTVKATAFVGSGADLVGLTATQIPSLDASKITAGTLDAARIPGLDGSKLTDGTIADARLSSNIPRKDGTGDFQGAVSSQNSLVIPNGIIDRSYGNSLTLKGFNAIHFRNFSGARYNVSEYFGPAGTMTFTEGGRLGISTSTPRVPLDVAEGVWESDGNWTTIRAEGVIKHAGLVQTSDRRVKTVLGRSDPVQDLALIRRVNVTDFRWIRSADQPAGRVEKGFIAQEVKEIIPDAVTVDTRFIPSINCRATAVTHDGAGKTLTVSLPKPHDLRAGDKVRLLSRDLPRDFVVAETPSDRVFRVADCASPMDDVFVHGKEVNDFMSVNYDRVFISGVAAIQELARQVDELRATRSRVAELEQKAARVDVLEREVAELKRLMAQVVNPAGGRDAVASSQAQVSSVGR